MALNSLLFRKCMNKIDCLVHEILLLIRELTPSLEVRPTAIRTQFKQNQLLRSVLILSEFSAVKLFAFEIKNGVTMSPKCFSYR